jgi:arylsulfatase A-like enzyme
VGFVRLNQNFLKQMKRLLLLLAGLGLTVMTVLAVPRKPNILYINADDLGVMDIGYNSERYITPNIDRLAEQGMVFTEAYAPAANCAPSRACVFSGQFTTRHGVYTVNNSDRGNAQHRRIIPVKNTLHLEDEMFTLAEALKSAGYATIHLGKWHLGEDPTTQGFDVNIAGDTLGGPSGGYFTPFTKGSMVDYNDRYPAGTHRVDILSDEAITFMREHKDEPMFIHMAWFSIHTRLEAVPEFIDKYKDKDVHAVYASMIEKMDQGIGRLMDELDRLGLADNTLVVFCSDNGGIAASSSQAPYRAGKGSYFEGGVRVPLVVRWPGKIKAGTSSDIPVTGLDFYPTFVEVAKISLPKGKDLDGTSIVPLMRQKGKFPERTLYWHFPIYLQKYNGVADESHDPLFRTRPGTIMRQGKWKLHEYFEDGRLELYNLASDIGERKNLASTMPEKAKEMHRQMVKWRKTMKAPVPTEKNPKFDPKEEAKAIGEQKKKAKGK